MNDRIKFSITFSGETNFETLKKEFKLPKKTTIENAKEIISKEFQATKTPFINFKTVTEIEVI